MNEQEKASLIKTELRSLDNAKRIGEIMSEQKAIQNIAISVELIAQRMNQIEEKVDYTNQRVDAQVKALQEVERAPLKQTYSNINSVKVAIISTICTALTSGLLAAIIASMK